MFQRVGRITWNCSYKYSLIIEHKLWLFLQHFNFNEWLMSPFSNLYFIGNALGDLTHLLQFILSCTDMHWMRSTNTLKYINTYASCSSAVLYCTWTTFKLYLCFVRVFVLVCFGVSKKNIGLCDDTICHCYLVLKFQRSRSLQSKKTLFISAEIYFIFKQF